MPKKVCLNGSCNNLVSKKEKYCSICKPKMDQVKKEKNRKYDDYVREEKTVKFYISREWKRVRQAALVRDHHLCQECLKHNIIKSAEIVHHIIEIKVDWNRRLDITNCESVCKSCHNKLHI